jgi:hypothetical protein
MMAKKPTEAEMWARLADFLVEDLMAASDEEILAESSPEEIAEAKRELTAAIIRAECGVGQSQPEAEQAKGERG